MCRTVDKLVYGSATKILARPALSRSTWDNFVDSLSTTQVDARRTSVGSSVDVNALSEYLEEKARTDGLSIRGFARRCEIAIETARRLLTGRGQPDDETLQKVADKLPAPLGKLRELAGVSSDVPEPFVLPSWADKLTPDERRTVRGVARQILASSGRLGGEDRQPEQGETPAEHTGGNVRVLHPNAPDLPRVKRAARKRPKPDATESDENGRQGSLSFTHMD